VYIDPPYFSSWSIFGSPQKKKSGAGYLAAFSKKLKDKTSYPFGDELEFRTTLNNKVLVLLLK
jgi:hypothetical protein